MSHEQRRSLRQLGNKKLEQMFARGKGTSKHKDKTKNHGKPDPKKIYTDSTLRVYKRAWNYFCDYLKIQGFHPRTIEEASKYVQSYINEMESEGLSAFTIHTWVSAICKVIETPLASFDLPRRYRRNIKRSRYPAIRDAHFSEFNNSRLVHFCRAVGPRNNKELQKIRGIDLVNTKDGYGIFIRQGKGGKERVAQIVAPAEIVTEIVKMCECAGEDLLFPHVSSAADIHGFRAEYACNVYRKFARDVKSIPRDQRYYCRSDMYGEVYDKEAMRIASEALGHSRIGIIAQSYLWKLHE